MLNIPENKFFVINYSWNSAILSRMDISSFPAFGHLPPKGEGILRSAWLKLGNINILRLLALVILLILQMSAYAATPTTTLTQLLSTIQTMQADFTQTINDNKGKLTEQSTGHMALQRPGKFRWEITNPVKQLVVANNMRLWIYDPELEQVTIRLLNKEIDNTPAVLLSNPDAAIEKNFKVQTIKNAAALQWFALLPKKHDSMLAFIKIGFAHDQIREIDLQDHLGHNTVIEFYNVVLNHPLSSSLFYFTPPAHTDVIDETKHR